MQDFMDTFDNLGWLANALGIIAFCWGVILLVNRVLNRRADGQDLSRFYTNDLDASWDPSFAKKFAVTAIVDDKPADFPSTALRAAGYKIEVVKSVSLTELDELAMKDVLFLDIKGIVKDDPERGGLHVIEKLRERNQFQKICAVSSQTFDPTATAFFKKAEDQRIKPLTEFECQETIDRFISEMFQLDKLFEESNMFARTLSGQERKRLIELMQDFAVERSTDKQLIAGLRKLTPLIGKQHVLYSFARILQSEDRRIRTQ
jgi:CheY-like chemotaxis protein